MKQKYLINLVKFLLIIIIMGFFMFPIFWLFLTSFKNHLDVFSIPPKIFFNPTIENYLEVIQMHNFFAYYKNTIIISLTSTFISMILGTLGAYALAR